MIYTTRTGTARIRFEIDEKRHVNLEGWVTDFHISHDVGELAKASIELRLVDYTIEDTEREEKRKHRDSTRKLNFGK